MWVSETMTLSESLMISSIGLSVVVSALLLLALTTMIFSKNLALLGITGDRVKSSPIQNAGKVSLNEEEYAVLISAISEEINKSLDEFIIKEIKEIKE